MEVTMTTDKFNVLYFSAPWCGPCRAFAPIFDEVKAEMVNIEFIKVDTDQNPDLAAKYEIKSIPTTVIVKNDVVLDSRRGPFPKNQFVKWITDTYAN